MKNNIMRFAFVLASLSISDVALCANPMTIPLDPKVTYLRIYDDGSAKTCVPLELPELGLGAGDLIKLRTIGDCSHASGSADERNLAIGVFSLTDTILSGTNQYRIPDAIDAGIDYVTPVTFFGSYATDIAEDFAIPASSVIITIPPDAIFLFVCDNDSYYTDNTDPDGDYTLEITKIVCDMDNDCYIYMGDLAIMAQQWLKTVVSTPLPADLNWDGNVNILDFGILAAHWEEYPSGCFPE